VLLKPEVLGRETDVVLTPVLHDTAGEPARPYGVSDWKRDGVVPVPGRTTPAVTVVERDYPSLYSQFTSVGPLLEKIGNGSKGIGWNTNHEVEFLRALNGMVAAGPATGQPRLETDIHAVEAILSLAPETNGEVAVKAWEALGRTTGLDHTHLALAKEDEKFRFRDIVAQPRKIISSPTWSGIESDKVCYNAGYTNVHELIPWRTLTGGAAIRSGPRAHCFVSGGELIMSCGGTVRGFAGGPVADQRMQYRGQLIAPRSIGGVTAWQHPERPTNAAAAEELLAAIADEPLLKRVQAAAGENDVTPGIYVAATIRHLIDHGSEEVWLNLVGQMANSPQPGKAASQAILMRAFPAPVKVRTPVRPS
jgi:hypothetical protein